MADKLCDVCGQGPTGQHEEQEWFYHNWTGGYSSIFGDEQNFTLTVCQICFAKAFAKHVKCLSPNVLDYDPEETLAYAYSPNYVQRLQAEEWEAQEKLQKFSSDAEGAVRQEMRRIYQDRLKEIEYKLKLDTLSGEEMKEELDKAFGSPD